MSLQNDTVLCRTGRISLTPSLNSDNLMLVEKLAYPYLVSFLKGEDLEAICGLNISASDIAW